MSEISFEQQRRDAARHVHTELFKLVTSIQSMAKIHDPVALQHVKVSVDNLIIVSSPIIPIVSRGRPPVRTILAESWKQAKGLLEADEYWKAVASTTNCQRR